MCAESWQRQGHDASIYSNIFLHYIDRYHADVICDEHGELVRSQGRSTHKPEDFDPSSKASGHGPLLGGFDLIETTTVITSIEHYYR